MGASGGRQFLLLLWKNWLLQKRRKVLTAFEIGLPILMSGILLVVRQLTESTPYPDARTWDPFTIETFGKDFNLPRPNCTSIFGCAEVGHWVVAYSPNTPVTTDIIDHAASKLNLSYISRYLFR